MQRCLPSCSLQAVWELRNHGSWDQWHSGLGWEHPLLGQWVHKSHAESLSSATCSTTPLALSHWKPAGAQPPRVQERWLSFSCFICLSEHLLFSADSYLMAVFNSSTYITLLVFFLLSKTEFFHLEMTDEVNQLKREKRSIREWGREYLHKMWVVVLIASSVPYLCQ